MIVDGYNVLSEWKPTMRSQSIDDARDQLTEALRDYAGYIGHKVVVVYDAWMSNRKVRTIETAGHLTVVFTQKGETADCYIERMADELAGNIRMDKLEVRVATSDRIEQTVIFGRGCVRVSARELINELENVRQSGKAHAATKQTVARSTIMDRMSDDVRQKLDRMRRGTNG